jgi:hypothetical protein
MPVCLNVCSWPPYTVLALRPLCAVRGSRGIQLLARRTVNENFAMSFSIPKAEMIECGNGMGRQGILPGQHRRRELSWWRRPGPAAPRGTVTRPQR